MKLQPGDKYSKTCSFPFLMQGRFRSRRWKESISRLGGNREKGISRHKPSFSIWQFCLGPILFIFTWAQITKNWGQMLVFPSAWWSRTCYRERGRERTHFCGGVFFPNWSVWSLLPKYNSKKCMSFFKFFSFYISLIFHFLLSLFSTFLLQAFLFLLILDLHHDCGKWREF